MLHAGTLLMIPQTGIGQHRQTITQWGGEGYREYKLDYSDLQTIHQAVAVLDPSAKMTNMTEGTKYPTCTLPLVVPMITRVIQHAEKPTLNKPWDKMSSFGVLTQHIQYKQLEGDLLKIFTQDELTTCLVKCGAFFSLLPC